MLPEDVRAKAVLAEADVPAPRVWAHVLDRLHGMAVLEVSPQVALIGDEGAADAAEVALFACVDDLGRHVLPHSGRVVQLLVRG